MARLGHSFSFTIKPVAPYSFGLTVKKPAGWSLFTPFEIYEDGKLWTATYLDGRLAGILLRCEGSVGRPLIGVQIFFGRKPDARLMAVCKRQLWDMLGAGQSLGEFYSMAKKDNILKHTVKDLYGMHDTFSGTIFSEAVLSILLQMTPLKRSNEMMSKFIESYGEEAHFKGKKVMAWPTYSAIDGVGAQSLAKTCKIGYRAKRIVQLANRMSEGFPSAEELYHMDTAEAKRLLLELPGIGDYSADIINPHGGFPIDVWSAEVFGKLFFGRKPANNRNAVDRVKAEGMRRWGKWAWMAFFYVAQDLKNLSDRLGMDLRLS